MPGMIIKKWKTRPPRRPVVGLCASMFAALLVSRPAFASSAGIPDGDSATLLGILMESVKQTTAAGQFLESMSAALGTAQSTLAVLRGASETVNEFRYLTEHPDEIFEAAQAAFEKTFPEAEGVRREADLLRQSLAEGPNGELNPYALQETLNAIGRTQDDFYQTLISLDEGIYGLSEGYLSLLSRQDTINNQGAAVFRETMDPGCRMETDAEGNAKTVCGLDQKRAAVLGAKSQAISAASLGIIGTVVTEQLRLAKLSAIRQLDDGVRMSATKLDHARGLMELTASVDETVDPTLDAAKAETFIVRPPSAYRRAPGSAP